MKDTIARLGERIPTHEKSQRNFKMAVILVENDEFAATDELIKILFSHIDVFTRNSRVGHIPLLEGLHNSWDATGGRANAETTQLQQHRISEDSIDESEVGDG